MKDFETWFTDVVGFAPHRWQREIGEAADFESRLIRIPTGFGKTLGVVSAWAYHRLVRQDDAWPRRLVFCLPMRVLVEQSAEAIRQMLSSFAPEVGVHTLMGGVDATEWHLSPEKPAVLVGTQDMLLSRALNRGYAAARGRWPMEYALINNDSLWIMDEVQLMDVGLVTSVQCQGFRDDSPRRFGRPSATWWMSATLQPDWLRTVDSEAGLVALKEKALSIRPTERTGRLFEIKKSARTVQIPRADDKECKGVAAHVVEAHRHSSGGEHGHITLAVMNTVKDAILLFEALQKHPELKNEKEVELRLVHSRFRGAERSKWREEFLRREACSPEANRIIVATQVVEAGVDISATALVTQLAPWPSLVQRFGRAARYGGAATITVIDRALSDKQCAPYEEPALLQALQALSRLEDVGLQSLEEFEEALQRDEPEFLRALYPYDPLHVLRYEELGDLFDTDPDLTGSDVDVSRFIRSGDERDLKVWWHDVEPGAGAVPSENLQPKRDALCSVPVHQAREWLCASKSTRLKDKVRAWYWSYLEGCWAHLSGRDLQPGLVVLVAKEVGGYSPVLGFTDKLKKKGESIVTEGLSREPRPTLQADMAQDHEDLSQNPYKTIATHGAEAAAEVLNLTKALGIDGRTAALLALAARWHDYGKAHPAFQRAIRLEARDESVKDRTDLAKAPQGAWRRGHGIFGERRGFRHELASTLALFESLRSLAPRHEALLGQHQELIDAGVLHVEPVESGGAPASILEELAALSGHEFNLVAYLVCAHHGKVRCSWQSTPHDQEYMTRHGGKGAPIRGVHEGDTLPATLLASDSAAQNAEVPLCSLSLDLANLGLSGRYGQSWQERVFELRKYLGDPDLAFLETLLRVADIRASRLETSDPLLAHSSESK